MSDDMMPRSDGSSPPDLFACPVLTKRSDFVRASRGKRVHSTSFVLQSWNRRDEDGPRVGFTCSKKVGNAVKRNRAKRRLREVARMVLPKGGTKGWDYVLIGRAEVTAATQFTDLLGELETALQKMHPQ